MIFKEYTVIVKGNEATINEPVYLYRYDQNVELRFNVGSANFKYSNSDKDNIVAQTGASFCQVRFIHTRTKTKYTFDVCPTVAGQAVLLIKGELIDEEAELGDYDFQIRLLDEGRNSIASLPPVKGAIHIEKPLFDEDVDTPTVNSAIVNIARLNSNGDATDTYNPDGTYNKTNWGTGDIITASKLNKLEAVSKDNVDKIKALPNQTVDLTPYAKKAEIPTKTSQLTNDSSYITQSEVDLSELDPLTNNIVVDETLDYSDLAIGGENGTGDANKVKITDAGGHYTSDTVEGALQEVSSQIKDKANKNEVRMKDVNIRLNDCDSKLLLAIQGGQGTSFDLLSIPRDSSVTPEKTTFINNNISVSFERGAYDVHGYHVNTQANVRARSASIIEGYDELYIVRKNSNYVISYFTLDGTTPDKTDVGWQNKDVINIPKGKNLLVNVKKADNSAITDEEIANMNNYVEVRYVFQAVSKDYVETINNKVDEYIQHDSDIKASIINSINVEHGRKNGASYVFARIPRTTSFGKKLIPKVRLTSNDGSLNGTKRSTLNYSVDNKCIFVVNAGLFNTGTMIPQGQTIIDGVSITNAIMPDDMGAPIHDKECYPLCIKSDGTLEANHYRTDADTGMLLKEGVVQAVTGWGKIIDNFLPCADTVENEIVHKGKYIRQSIGQFQNGDYFVCTVDMSRNNVTNEAGISYSDLAELFVSKGVKFAYSLDGGGSAETVLGTRQLNPIYEGHHGRAVPTVIVFEIE